MIRAKDAMIVKFAKSWCPWVAVAAVSWAQAATMSCAEGVQARFDGVITAAAQHLRMGQPIRAQLALRRGFNTAQSPQEQALMARVFAAAADMNPLTLDFSASVTPSSNFNGGAAQEYFRLGDIALAFPPAARALSGTEILAQLDLGYRLARSDAGSTALGLSLWGRTYLPSAQTRAAAPQVSGSDYAQFVAEIALRQQIVLGAGLGLATVSAHLGRVEYGRAPFYRYHRLTVGQQVDLSARLRAGWQISREIQSTQSTQRTDAQVTDFKMTLSKHSQSGGQWTLALAQRRTLSPIASDTFTDSNLAAGFTAGRALFGVKPTLSITLGQKSYDDYILSFDGRRDRYASASLSLLFEDAAIFGFSPIMTLSATRTLSNVARFDTAEARASFGLQSRF